MIPRFEDHHRHAEAIIAAVLEAADPAIAMGKAWPAELNDGRPTALIAIGKASLEMARAAADRLGPSLRRGVVLAVPERIAEARLPAVVTVMGVDHPLPTERNISAARAVAELTRAAPDDMRVIVLISGGGSAHLTLPADGVRLEEIVAVTRALQRSGATIHELNTVRKHAEVLKGGGLGVLLAGREARVFVLSDVIGDALETIASGPCVPDPTTYAEAMAVLDRHGAADIGPGLAAHLRRGISGEVAETVKPGDAQWREIPHTIIASNAVAVDAAARAAAALGFEVIERRTDVEGSAAKAGLWLGERVRSAAAAGRGPVAVVMGGETTVDVAGASGRGGPSQETALAAAIAMAGMERAAALAFSTDGVDGPTDGAGAIVSGATAAEAKERGRDLGPALATHDSHGVLGALGAVIRTGPTGTNVNHIAAGLIYG